MLIFSWNKKTNSGVIILFAYNFPVTIGWTAPLQVMVDRNSYTRNEFCVGDYLTLICELQSNVHEWTVPNIGTGEILRNSNMTLTVGNETQFTLDIVTRFTSSVKSSLSVVVVPELGGTVITCSDGNSQVKDTYTATVTLLGKTVQLCMSILSHLIW